MFSKNSRYKNLAESSPVNARRERLRGKDLRIIPATAGQFLHTVRDGDRLDLLAFKYYGDPTKWWQITDANPEPQFPTDLLDPRPIVEEIFVFANASFVSRYEQLLATLSAFGEVRRGQANVFTVTPGAANRFEEVKLVEPDFLQLTVTVIYPPSPSTHRDIVNVINKRFYFLRSFAWVAGARTAEAFTFEDPAAKSDWLFIMDSLQAAPGVLEAQSFITEATLRVVYNSESLKRESIIALAQSKGFALEPAKSLKVSRTGARIIIPPNQVS